MKILIISDGHGALDMLGRLENIAKTADFILFAGDFAALHKVETGQPFLERLIGIHDQVFAVTGNCDAPDFRDVLETADISVEGSLVYFSGLVLTGSGGGSKFMGDTPNERSDEELAGDLHLIVESVGDDSPDLGEPWNNLIVISHNPPKDTALDAAGNGMHVGSPLFRKFIETYKPLLVVCGHIHESIAVDTIGETTLVNPGPLVSGYYALAEISGDVKKGFSVESVTLHTL